jgi:Delta3-Delta2-enoyl-CoA isomerase
MTRLMFLNLTKGHSMPPALTKSDQVWTLNIGDDENRFSPDWLTGMEEALADVRASDEPCALVIAGSGKFYSNGLDLEWILGHADQWTSYVARVQGIFSNVLTLPVPTVAAINGHCFAAGAMLALACDYRVMRNDRGFFCLPEVDINIPFSPGMSALIMSKLTPRVSLDAMSTGRRYDAPSALSAGIVDAICSIEDLPEASAGFVRELAGKDRTTLGTIKSVMFADAVDALAQPLDGFAVPK